MLRVPGCPSTALLRLSQIQRIAEQGTAVRHLPRSCRILEAYLGLGVHDTGSQSPGSVIFTLDKHVDGALGRRAGAPSSVSSRTSPVSTTGSSSSSSNGAVKSPGARPPSTSVPPSLTQKFCARSAVHSSAGGGPLAHVKTCEECCREFPTRTNYLRHMREVHKKEKYPCAACGRMYTRDTYLRSHACRPHAGS